MFKVPLWHAGGQEFESPWLHSQKSQSSAGTCELSVRAAFLMPKRLKITFPAQKLGVRVRVRVLVLSGASAKNALCIHLNDIEGGPPLWLICSNCY